ncbi:MAG TPA: M17 family peptidase N-terminal domain-containing protein, partial [Mycobacteriales bacterium]|nr:M17 family peptidase N-terminal domain-containing protein [Mycobacteriales bacterium]
MTLPRLRLSAGPLAADVPAIAVPVEPSPAGPILPRGTGPVPLDVSALLRRESATGEPGEVVAVPVSGAGAVELVLLAGVGDRSPAALRRAGAALARRAGRCVALATTVGEDADDEGLRALAEGLLLASYTFNRKSEPKPRALAEVTLVVADHAARAEALRRAIVTASAATRARDLINTPSSEKSPEWLAEQAVAVARDCGLTARVWDESALAADGFGGLLAVAAGSARPPRLVQLDWAPAGARGRVVLVGKGITFDSGGLSLKPADAMVPMKTDMAGAGAVIGAMSAVRDLGVPARVTALLACAENLPGAAAQRPGDVIRHHGGRTVEVLNTDAEGRLVLADALAYAVERLDPDVIVDLATLTGAATVGLGKLHGALYATSDAVAGELARAAALSGERVWRMPLVDDYRSGLDSP